MSLSYFWSYIYYLTQARSEYYVHSPFVYRLMCRCLPRRKRLRCESREALFARLQEYIVQQGIAPGLTRIPPAENPCEVFYGLPAGERTAVFVDLPHRDSGRESAWQTLCNDPDIALSIDLFRAGVVFPYLDMSKEHFCLRYF